MQINQHRIFLGIILLCSGIFAQDPNFHIYLALGQSNMEGQGTIEKQDETVDSRFQVIEALDCPNLGRSQGIWYSAVPPLFRCNTGLSPVDYFGRTLVAKLPVGIKVGVVNVAVAGSKIELFDKANYLSYTSGVEPWMKTMIDEYGGNPYGRLVAMAKLAQKTGVIKGILLHQGESNSGDQLWPSKVKAIYKNLLADLGLDSAKVPLLAGEVVQTAMGGVCGGMNAIIGTLPKTISTAYVISSSGLAQKGDSLHFTSASYRTLGARYAEKMLTLLGDLTPNPVVVSFGAPLATDNFDSPATIPIEVKASSTAGNIAKVEIWNGTQLLVSLAAPPYTYQWKNVTAGAYSLKALATDDKGNTAQVGVSIKAVAPQVAYGGTPWAIPGLIELENFDVGENGSAYLDNTVGSETGVALRTGTDVDLEVCTDVGGGYNIGWATVGEWLEYSVNVATAGTYSVDVRAACNGTGRTISLQANGKSLASDLAIPNTGGWQAWENVTVNELKLDTGVQVIRLTIGAVDYVNLNSMTFTLVKADPVPVALPLTQRINVQGAATGSRKMGYDLNGKRLP